MAITASVKHERTKGARGMTLRELQRFIDEAFVAGFSPDALPRVTVTWSSGLQRIEVTGEVNPP